MTSFLDDLLAGARRRVEASAALEPLDELQVRASAVATPAPFRRALQEPGVGVIAEVKRASPSKGDLAPGIVAAEQGAIYRDAGAAAISVLTEPDRFKGSLEDLADVAALDIPTLRKDFLVDRYQVWEARAAGASAVLLIAAALDDDALRSLLAEVAEADLDALVEVHDEEELQRANAAGARIVGVNARDLRSFEVDRDAFARLRPSIPSGVVAIAESGVRGPDDVRTAAEQGADAVLVGEALVTAIDPGEALAAMVRAGRESTRQTAGA